MMNHLLAACMFFTRIPLWRWVTVAPQSFKRVVPWWALTGWLTAGVSVAVLSLASLVVPASVAFLLAMISRLLLTGCLHEDGLADFIDGFGGGHTRERILSIMKDSHIGAYGTVGLIMYFGLYYLLLSGLPLGVAGSIMLVADPFSRMLASMTVHYLPYARKEEEAKNRVIYNRMTGGEFAVALLCGLLPLLWLPEISLLGAILFPVLTWGFLYAMMKRRLGGYTGDCCGAVFLLCELSFYLGIVIFYKLI